MPTYVYRCECGRTFEAQQRMADDPLTMCDCELKMGVSREIAPSALMFRGTGFYETDYKRKGDGAQ